MRELFRVTEPKSMDMLKQVHGLIRYTKEFTIAYQSNYYCVVACLDIQTARTLIALIRRHHCSWNYETREGRQGKYHYVKIYFK